MAQKLSINRSTSDSLESAGKGVWGGKIDLNPLKHMSE